MWGTTIKLAFETFPSSPWKKGVLSPQDFLDDTERWLIFERKDNTEDNSVFCVVYSFRTAHFTKR